VKGLESILSGPCMYTANHQSHFDVPVLFEHLPGHVCFVAKESLFKIPFFDSALKNTGFVKYGSVQRAHDQQEFVNSVPDRTSLLFFAEAPQSDNGVPQPYKKVNNYPCDLVVNPCQCRRITRNSVSATTNMGNHPLMCRERPSW